MKFTQNPYLLVLRRLPNTFPHITGLSSTSTLNPHPASKFGILGGKSGRPQDRDTTADDVQTGGSHGHSFPKRRFGVRELRKTKFASSLPSFLLWQRWNARTPVHSRFRHVKVPHLVKIILDPSTTARRITCEASARKPLQSIKQYVVLGGFLCSFLRQHVWLRLEAASTVLVPSFSSSSKVPVKCIVIKQTMGSATIYYTCVFEGPVQ